jgi:hypothetical protein
VCGVEDRATREELLRKHNEKENNPVESVNGVEASSNLPNTEGDSSVDKQAALTVESK